MNKERIEKLMRSLGSLKSARLNQDEKQQMLQNIRFAMREQAAEPKRSAFSLQSFSFRAAFSNKYSIATLCAVVVIISSAGISKAAANSLPGDFLYPIKTNVNEKIQAALAATPEKKAQVETDIAVTRLEEAEALQQQGKLDQQKEAEITQNLAEHAQAAQKTISEVQQNVPQVAEQLNQQFDDSLHMHMGILDRLASRDSHDQQPSEQAGQKQGGQGPAAQSQPVQSTAPMHSERMQLFVQPQQQPQSQEQPQQQQQQSESQPEQQQPQQQDDVIMQLRIRAEMHGEDSGSRRQDGRHNMFENRQDNLNFDNNNDN